MLEIVISKPLCMGSQSNEVQVKEVEITLKMHRVCRDIVEKDPRGIPLSAMTQLPCMDSCL